MAERRATGRALQPSTRGNRPQRSADAARAESRSTGGGIPADSNDRGSRGFAAPVFHDAGGGVCRNGASAGHAGNLWGDFVFGYAEDAGNRREDGTGRDRWPRTEAGADEHAALSGSGYASGSIAFGGVFAGNRFATVRDVSVGCADLSGDGGGAAAGGAGRRIYACAKSITRGADESVESRLSGGEGGIRSLSTHFESVSYRFDVRPEYLKRPDNAKSGTRQVRTWAGVETSPGTCKYAGLADRCSNTRAVKSWRAWASPKR